MIGSVLFLLGTFCAHFLLEWLEPVRDMHVHALVSPPRRVLLSSWTWLIFFMLGSMRLTRTPDLGVVVMVLCLLMSQRSDT